MYYNDRDRNKFVFKYAILLGLLSASRAFITKKHAPFLDALEKFIINRPYLAVVLPP